MKKLLFFLTLFFLMSVSCERSDLGENYFSIGEKTTFKAGTIYYSSNGNLQFQFAVTSDSRCPVGLYCIWAGEVSVEIIMKQTEKTDTLEVSSLSPVVEAFGLYSLTLHEVHPYPESSKAISPNDYSMEMTVSKIE